MDSRRLFENLGSDRLGDADWLDAVADVLANGECSRPFRTPGGQLVRCRSRLRSVCPSCAEQTRGDWAAIARSGVFDPPPGRKYRFFLLTLTAPSFGRVHFIPNPEKGRGPKRCSCGAWHSDAQAGLSGVPVDLSGYDYDGAVAFNYGFGRLWNNTKTRLREWWDSLAFFAVREWQDRGVLHLHAIVRVDASEGATPLEVELRAKSARARNPLDGSRMGWGSQSKCDSLATDGDGARSIWYVSKVINYAHKDLGTRYGDVVPQERREHLARLSEAARRLRCDAAWVDAAGVVHECPEGGCVAKLHENWGARGHVVTYSRPTQKRAGWSFTSLTRRAQREKRLAWVLANQAPARAPSDFAGARWAASYLRRKRAREAWAANQGRAP